MVYLIRGIDGFLFPAFGFAAALAVLRAAGAEASVYTLGGRWVAGRKVLP